MAQLKIKQLRSSLSYDEAQDKLTIAGSSLKVEASSAFTAPMSATGSISIQGIDTFGDAQSSTTVDLGDY